jgi:hypothetical protein
VPGVPAPKKKKKGVLIAAAVAVVLVLGAGGAWALHALRSYGGASSPDDAVRVLLKDAAASDYLKVASHIAPSERDVVAPWIGLPEMLGFKVKPNEEAQKAYDAITKAMKVELKDLETSSEPLVTGVERTKITGGTVSVDADVDALTKGMMDYYDAIGGSSTFSQGLGVDISVTESEIRAEIEKTLPMTKDVDDLKKLSGLDDLFLVTVEEDGKWYTSVSMTAAQYVFEASGGAKSKLGEPIAPDKMQGTDKPEQAPARFAEALKSAGETGDIRELARVLPVAESRLLAVYGPTFADDPETIKDILGGWSLTDVRATEFYSEGNYSVVTLDSAKLAVASGGDQTLITYERSDTVWNLDISGADFERSVVLEQPDSKTVRLEAKEDGDLVAEATVTIPEKGVLTVDAEADGSTIKSRIDGECMEATVDGKTEEMCFADLGVDPSDSGFNELQKLPDLKGVLSLTTIKGAGGKWYVSLLGAPLTTVIPIAGAGAMFYSQMSGLASLGDFDPYGYSEDEWSEDWDEDSWSEDLGDEDFGDDPWSEDLNTDGWEEEPDPLS